MSKYGIIFQHQKEISYNVMSMHAHLQEETMLDLAVRSKPLRWETASALQFSNPQMVEDYARRDPYCPEAFAAIRHLMVNSVALDIGAGSGDVTIPLSQIAEHVDAVDISAPMMELAYHRPGGNNPRIHWYHGKLEDLSLEGSYGVVTAGDSIHWMDWPEFFPVLRAHMAPGAVLIILERGKSEEPWRAPQRAIQASYYTEPDNGRYDVVEELQSRGHFLLEGDLRTNPLQVRKSLNDYIREIHSRNGFSRARLGERKTRELDARLAELIRPYLIDGLVHYQTFTRMRWGLVLESF